MIIMFAHTGSASAVGNNTLITILPIRMWRMRAGILIRAWWRGFHASCLTRRCTYNHGCGIGCGIIRTLQKEKNKKSTIIQLASLFTNFLQFFMLCMYIFLHRLQFHGMCLYTCLATVIESAHISCIHFGIVCASIWSVVWLTVGIR